MRLPRRSRTKPAAKEDGGDDGQILRELTLPVRETLGLFFGNPRKVSHQAAKVPAVETGILIGHHVGEAGALAGPGRCFRPS